MKNIVFFSGGSALASTAREMASRNWPATYLITTFDSGGSTQELRRVFNMPAVGDLRNRLLASANTRLVTPATLSFLNQRINAAPGKAALALGNLLDGADWQQFSSGDAIREDLEFFLAEMPPAFNAENASMGNLALAGAYLRAGRKLEAALNRYSAILHVTGRIMAAAHGCLHLGAELQDGSELIGQHILNKQLCQPVKRIFLTTMTPWESGRHDEVRPLCTEAAVEAIRKADVICYSMGSFYSSILVNLLAKGVGTAIANSKGIKIFIPNTGVDPELQGLDIAGQAEAIISTLRNDRKQGDFVDIALVDSRSGDYPPGENIRERLCSMGVETVSAPIVQGAGRHDPEALLAALDSLA